MSLRPAVDSDRDSVRDWRNHPTVRAKSMHQAFIPLEDHITWWAAVKADPTRQVLIYEQDGHDCGVVTFQRIDHEAGSAYWGFFLDNDGLDAREGTLKAWMQIQREAVVYADTELDLETLDSDVLEANTGVLKFNQRNGCAIVGERDIEVDGRTVHVMELRRSRTAQRR